MAELCWRERGRLWLRLGIRLVLTALFVWVLARFGPPLLSLFMPFVLALVLAWLLNPAIRAIQRHIGIGRKPLSFVLILLLFAAAGGLLFALIYNIVIELWSLVANWETIFNALRTALEDLTLYFSRFMDLIPAPVETALTHAVDYFVQWLNATLPTLLSTAAGHATNLAVRVPSFAVATVVFIMGSYFITADYPHICFLAGEHMNPGLRDFMRHVRDTAGAAFGGYVKAEVILSIGVFLILLVGFAVIGQPYGLLLAFLLAVLDFIPIVGAGTAMVPWAVVDLCLGDLRHAIELMVIWGIIALFRRVGEPKVVGDQTGLPPVLSLVSIYVGMKLGGVWGMILGPVALLIIINIAKSGVFAGTAADLSLAFNDIAALLKNRPGNNNSKNV